MNEIEKPESGDARPNADAVITISDQEPDKQGEDDEINFSPFFAYLETPYGHEVAKQVLEIVRDLKKSTLDKTHTHATWGLWLRTGIFVFVIGAASVLAWSGKLDSTASGFLGVALGYALGSRQS